MTDKPHAIDEAIEEALRRAGQEHVLAAMERLSPRRRRDVQRLLAGIDLDAVKQALRRRAEASAPDALPPPVYSPQKDGGVGCGEVAMARPGLARPGLARSGLARPGLRGAGAEIIRRGAVAVCVMADATTRLRWRGPLGTFPATAVTGKPLFQCLAEQIRFAQSRYGVTIPWCILTGPHNDEATRAYFADNNCFGLRRRDIIILMAPAAPVIDAPSGRLLLDGAGEPAVGSAGSGGLIAALEESETGSHLAARGIELLSFLPVDNPMGALVDPLQIGLHGAAPEGSGEITLKVVEPVAPDANLPAVARVGGRIAILDSRASQPRGIDLPRSTGMGVVTLRFLRTLAGRLPQRFLDWPGAEGAVRIGTLIDDAVGEARTPVLMRVDPAEEYGPIQAPAGPGSAAESRRLQCERAARWLEARGVRVARTPDGMVDALIEISALTAREQDDLAGVDLPGRIESGAEVVL